MSWYTYILRCSDGSLYVGISNNVEQRVKRHNEGLGAAYTRSHRPVVLLWKELAENESAARRREAQIKGWTRIKKMNLVNYGNPNGLDESGGNPTKIQKQKEDALINDTSSVNEQDGFL